MTRPDAIGAAGLLLVVAVLLPPASTAGPGDEARDSARKAADVEGPARELLARGNPCGLGGKCVVRYPWFGGSKGCAKTAGPNPDEMGYDGCNTKWKDCKKCRSENCPDSYATDDVPGFTDGGPATGNGSCSMDADGCWDPDECRSRLKPDGTRGMCRCDWWQAGGNPGS